MADGEGWKRRLAAQIVGMLPESDAEALELLDMARKMVTEFGAVEKPAPTLKVFSCDRPIPVEND